MKAWRKQLYKRRPSETGPWQLAPDVAAAELWELITTRDWQLVAVLPGGLHVFKGGSRPDRVTLITETFGETDIPHKWHNVERAVATFGDREFKMAWDFRKLPDDDWLTNWQPRD